MTDSELATSRYKDAKPYRWQKENLYLHSTELSWTIFSKFKFNNTESNRPADLLTR